MTKRVIFKYPIVQDPIFGNVLLKIPWTETSRVVLIAAQRSSDQLPTIWVEQPLPDRLTHTREVRLFTVVGTGDPYDPADGNWVGSAVCANGDLIWHVLQLQPELAEAAKF